MRRIGTVAGVLVLVALTIVVVTTVDARSHSASDTLRPVLLVLGPVWVAAIVGLRMLRRRDG